MQTSRDWHVILDQAGFMQDYGHTYAQALRRPGMAEIFDATFREAADLVEPAVAWNYFPCRRCATSR